ncbi:alpha/beta hydrolase [Gordonia sp. CPCC 205515]|uniref:alpha/beta fold hydrolase n=1 Tax=Gordonia sp. CPCC 205515 TaxID=3140791 RepID=UPI003AF3BAB6
MHINGTDLAVETDGPDDAPAIVMIHGLGATGNFYQIQAQALSENHRVVRIDSAGAGRSATADDISIGRHAEDVDAVFDALGIQSAAVVGHSMGTLVAREFAAKHPDKVTKLALLGAVAEPADAGRQAQRDRAAVLRDKGTSAVAPGVVANALSESTRNDKPEVAAFVRELVMRQDAEGYARNCEALAAAGDPGDIAGTIDLLLITGDQDKVGPPTVSQAIADTHGSATVKILPGVGHWTALEAAGPVTDLLVDFL